MAKDDALAKEVAKYIPTVFCVADGALEGYTADGYTQAIKAVVEIQDVKGVLIPHSYDGVDYAAKVAMAIGAGIVSNCNKARVDGGKIIFTRNTYNGKIQEEKSVNTDKFVATFEKGAYDMEAAGGAGAGAAGRSGGSRSVKTTARTSITDRPGIASARSRSAPRPASSRIVPSRSGRNSFMIDSPEGRGMTS
jgi:electron transfer flavoprotein alpha subunit